MAVDKSFLSRRYKQKIKEMRTYTPRYVPPVEEFATGDKAEVLSTGVIIEIERKVQFGFYTAVGIEGWFSERDITRYHPAK